MILRWSNLFRDPATGAVRQWLREFALAAALLAGSGVWATEFWNTWTARGGQGEFFQHYFEPAVMVACGKGLVITTGSQPPALEDFLFRRRDSFSCSELPAHLRLGREYYYQGAWTYLELTVGWSWRLLGISWSGMGPLFGLLFGAVVTLSYFVFRLGMGRLLAVGGAVAMAVSSAQLVNLPNLRDYAKAPFTIALVLILGLLITRPVRRWTVISLAVAYGAVLGVGYGFRTDFLVALPMLPLALFAFLDCGLRKQLWLKAGGTVLFIATFVVVSWPALTAVVQRGGCQWHVALLGLQTPFDERLNVVPAPYDFGHTYSDAYIYETVKGYARRVQPGAEPLVYCSPEYDARSGAYLRAIVTGFPADFVGRAYASVLQIVELPFAPQRPMDEWASLLYRVRARALAVTHRWGLLFVGVAVVLAGIADLRLAVALICLVAYYGGYPAIQFQHRHFFHLEFIGWWALGFVTQQVAVFVWSMCRQSPDWRLLARRTLRAGGVAAIALLLAASALLAARQYQARHVRQLLNAYLAASKVPVDDPAAPLPGVAPVWPQYYVAELDERACHPGVSLTFRYDRSEPNLDFTKTVNIKQRTFGKGLTRVMVPVFERFSGLETSDGTPGCLVSAYRLADPTLFPMLLGATLPPDWEALPLYQRFRAWDRD